MPMAPISRLFDRASGGVTSLCDRNPDVVLGQTRSRAQILAVAPRPPRALMRRPGRRLRSPPAAQLVPRSRASGPRRFAGGQIVGSRRAWPSGSWRTERESGPCGHLGADPPQAVRLFTRAGRGGGTHRGRSTPILPQRNRRSPSWPDPSSSQPVMVNGAPIRFTRKRIHVFSPATVISPCVACQRGVDPARSLSHADCVEPEGLSTPNWREQKLHRPASVAKAAERPHACAPPSIAGLSPSGPAGKAYGSGEATWTSLSSPAFTTGPSTATFFSKLSVMFRILLETLRLSQSPVSQTGKSATPHSRR